jgi:hypothetical protein
MLPLIMPGRGGWGQAAANSFMATFGDAWLRRVAHHLATIIISQEPPPASAGRRDQHQQAGASPPPQQANFPILL